MGHDTSDDVTRICTIDGSTVLQARDVDIFLSA